MSRYARIRVLAVFTLLFSFYNIKYISKPLCLKAMADEGKEDIGEVIQNNSEKGNLIGSVGNTDMKLNIVDSTHIDVEIPLDSTFVIGDNSYYPDIIIRNLALAPMEVIVTSTMRSTSETPNLLPPTKYSDDKWARLTPKETMEGIALGIRDTERGEVSWLGLEENIKIGYIEPRSETIFNLTSKHGLQWTKNVDLDYRINMIVRLKTD